MPYLQTQEFRNFGIARPNLDLLRGLAAGDDDLIELLEKGVVIVVLLLPFLLPAELLGTGKLLEGEDLLHHSQNALECNSFVCIAMRVNASRSECIHTVMHMNASRAPNA